MTWTFDATGLFVKRSRGMTLPQDVAFMPIPALDVHVWIRRAACDMGPAEKAQRERQAKRRARKLRRQQRRCVRALRRVLDACGFVLHSGEGERG